MFLWLIFTNFSYRLVNEQKIRDLFPLTYVDGGDIAGLAVKGFLLARYVINLS
ncbi:hypothetical protein [Dyadobacter psychrotolerans]|uniref:hypothetical protein n=1 Tax=Dyadobacter psychrotolerans TaxID=2541721 RepID=UPI001404A478|nr:hypothetical protein [Dyadobacter psychrotolerans]